MSIRSLESIWKLINRLTEQDFNANHPNNYRAKKHGEILDFDLNREGSFSSLRGSKEVLQGVPGRSFYEVLGFLQKKKF